MEQIYSACCTTLLIYSSVSRRKEDTNTTLHSRCSSFLFFLFCSDLGYTCAYVCACVCVRQYGFNVNAPCASALAHYHFPKTWPYIFCSFFFSVFVFFFGLVSAFSTFFSQNSLSGSCRSVRVIQNPAKAGKPLPLLFLFCFFFLHPASTFCRRFLFL